MKKIFFALAALVLAFTGCSQEEDAIQVSEKKAIKVVVNMDKPGFGEDTRAPRTGWEDGDQVIVALSDGLEIYTSGYIKLIYNVTEGRGAWTTEFWESTGKTSSSNFINNLYDRFVTDGSVKAAYFSSGVKSVEIPSLNITTNASYGFDKFGECVMTCEDGTYSFVGDVLTLTITMIPQVAQFTIRDLNVEDGWNISIEGPVNGYAGGKITPDGVELTLIEDVLYGYPHQNGNDISIFAAPWQSNADIPDFIRSLPGYEITSEESYKEPYYFTVHDEDTYWFVREFDYKEVAIGGAVIMDGPYTEDEDGNKTAGAQEWEE